MRPGLGELPQRNAQGRQPVEQARPEGQQEEEQPPEEEQPQAQEPEATQNAAPADVLDQQGRVIAESKQLVEQPREDAGRQVHAPTPQPEATQAAQPAGAAPLLGPALHERIAQAVRPVLEELRQGNAQARQSGE
jgi:hypothetical protein